MVNKDLNNKIKNQRDEIAEFNLFKVYLIKKVF